MGLLLFNNKEELLNSLLLSGSHVFARYSTKTKDINHVTISLHRPIEMEPLFRIVELLLFQFGIKAETKIVQGESSYSISIDLHNSEELIFIYKSWYPQYVINSKYHYCRGKKQLPNDFVLTDSILAMWYGLSGSPDKYIAKTKNGNIETVRGCNLSYSGGNKIDLKQLQDTLNTKFNLESSIASRSCILKLNIDNYNKLIDQVSNNLPKAMNYKLKPCLLHSLGKEHGKN